MTDQVTNAMVRAGMRAIAERWAERDGLSVEGIRERHLASMREDEIDLDVRVAIQAALDDDTRRSDEDPVGRRVRITNGDYQGRTGVVEGYAYSAGADFLYVYLDAVARPWMESFTLTIGANEVAFEEVPR